MAEQIKALLAEDDDLHREIIAELMQDAGMDVVLACDGAETVRMMESERYDVVVSDLVMPGKNGIEVLRTAKAMNPGTHVVIITGFGSMETLVEAIQAGAYDYITKPFKLEELRLLLKNVKERIALERSNQSLIQSLMHAENRNKDLEARQAALEEEMESIRNHAQEQENILSGLLRQFPFLTGSAPSASPKDLSEEENRRSQRNTPETEKKLITRA